VKWEHVQFLTVEEVEQIHTRMLEEYGGAPGVLRREGLEGAVMAPQATFAGRPLLATLADLAAAYAFYLVTSHCFADGNKRTALTSALAFLDVNGHPLTSSGDEWVEIMVRVAKGEISRELLAEVFASAMGQWLELTWD
jgi:death-on-curing protein